MADLFCLAETCLLADVIDWLLKQKISFEAGYVYNDVVKAVSDVHKSGALFRAVTKQPSLYVPPAPHLQPLLKRLKDANKKVFMLTNNHYDFVDHTLHYLIGPDWRQLFDIIITQADK
jgi:phosphoglycolate phosphatase-like HAD superfamily hydrolase